MIAARWAFASWWSFLEPVDQRLDLVLKADLAELDRAISQTEEFCSRIGASHRVSYHFALALDELLTNVVSYGHPRGGSHEVRLSFWLEGGTLFAEFVDDGVPFDPLRNAVVADTQTGLEERRVGGQGIHLIKTLMDGVTYEQTDGQNHLRFWKRLATE
jgi:serine/threonine-protein kinase RsbW